MCVPLARVVALVGRLALIAAYYAWFGSQGIILTGAFLDQLLGSTTDLRRLLPGAAGGPLEVQLLRALVDLFPLAGGLAASLSLAVSVQPAWRLAANIWRSAHARPLWWLSSAVSRACRPGDLGSWPVADRRRRPGYPGWRRPGRFPRRALIEETTYGLPTPVVHNSRGSRW